MIDLLQSARRRGEAALRRGAWTFAGAGLFVLGCGFAAAALVAAIRIVAPAYVAFGAAAIGLVIAASVCVARAQAPRDDAPAELGTLSAEAGAVADDSDWRSLLNEALMREARDKPARAAAIAAVAGLILGAIEGLDDAKSD